MKKRKMKETTCIYNLQICKHVIELDSFDTILSYRILESKLQYSIIDKTVRELEFRLNPLNLLQRIDVKTQKNTEKSSISYL